MQPRLLYLTLALTICLQGLASAQGSTVYYGPQDGHQALEVGTVLMPWMVTLAVDEYVVDPTPGPVYVGSLEASQFVLEIGPAWRAGPAWIGVGLRTWNHRVQGIKLNEEDRFLSPDNTYVDKWEAVYRDEKGQEQLRAGFTLVPVKVPRPVVAENEGRTEVALLVAGSTGAGRLLASWQATYGSSGLAWRPRAPRPGPASPPLGFEA